MSRVWEVVPHLEVSVRAQHVPAAHGVAAHNDYLATTACGVEVAATLVTRRRDLVKCAQCRQRGDAER